MLVVGANSGLAGMVKEHLGMYLIVEPLQLAVEL